MRCARITRKTAETDIDLSLDLDGTGRAEIDTGSGFLDHMLTLFARHGHFDLTVKCAGDIHVDEHHTTEDIGIALGNAFGEALGDKRGISRYGSMLLPMDEALILCAVDLSGRTMLRYTLSPPSPKVGTFDTELGEEFFWGFCRSCPMTIHLRQLDGTNSHHILEAGFKAFGRAMRQAVSIDPEEGGRIPSTKGAL
ncbi:MAG: imidazoleglycerol-phosphate dehydratase HisB [Clostridia bacterium]|nr:imidazoleglycerol-phosphate dehydratase HisB [Clostridia bacterium]